MRVRRQFSLRSHPRRWCGGDSSKTLRGRSPFAKKKKKTKGRKAAEGPKNQLQVVLNAMTVHVTMKKVLFKSEIGLVQVEIEDEMRP